MRSPHKTSRPVFTPPGERVSFISPIFILHTEITPYASFYVSVTILFNARHLITTTRGLSIKTKLTQPRPGGIDGKQPC